MIKITLKDDKTLSVDKGTTALEIVTKLSISLAKKTVAVYINGELRDLNTALNTDSSLEFILIGSSVANDILRHSTSHIMALAIKNLYPDTLFSIGPSTSEGFYYDFLPSNNIVEEDLDKITKEMERLIKEKVVFSRKVVSKEEAKEIFKNDRFKLEILEDAIGEISIYTQGNFVDLCRGPHLLDSSLTKHFKLLSIAGSYFKGDSSRDHLQRIYGTVFYSKEELDDYLKLLEERKERDHRKLGKDLKLFMFSPLVGQGLPIWLPKGAIIRQELADYILKLERKYKYQQVFTPVLGSIDLYKTSGHYEHYKEDMFAPIKEDNDEYILRPMSCPHHVIIYKSDLRSYKDLPLRYAEQVLQHRHEASGALTGMERVRAMSLTDSHVFCRMDQIKQEFSHAFSLIQKVLSDLKISVSYYRLSLHDPMNKEKYFDDPKMWEQSESMLRDVLKEMGVDAIEAIGEAAFYGPKLDIQIKTILGHDITMSTIQLDFLLPERFDLSYVDENANKIRPIMIHRGLIGTYERFLAILLEQNKGIFPFWLSPNQIAILPVSDNYNDVALKQVELLEDLGFRVNLDNRNEKLGYRLREAQVEKTIYTLVVGEKEKLNNTVTYRKIGSDKQVVLPINEFIDLITLERNNKS